MKRKNSQLLKNDLAAGLFLLPFLIFYCVFTIFPLLQGVYMSFHKWTLMGIKTWIGFGNYTKFLGDKFFWEALWNTTYFVILSTPLMIFVALGLALLANRNTPLKRLFRVGFYMPNVLSVAVVSYIAIYMLQPYMGAISTLLKSLGVTEEFFFLKDPNLAWYSIVFTTIWWTVGFNMMLYVSAMQEIPDQVYEAAVIDGATPFQQLIRITIPLLKSTTKLILLLQIIASFKVFGQIFLITQGGPGSKTRPLIQYIYEAGFKKNDLGYAAAMSYALFIILVLFTLIQLRLNKGEE